MAVNLSPGEVVFGHFQIRVTHYPCIEYWEALRVSLEYVLEALQVGSRKKTDEDGIDLLSSSIIKRGRLVQ